MSKPILGIDWMDANLINFMYYEGRLYDEIIQDGPSNMAFTKEFKKQVKNFLYDIADSKNFDFSRKNIFKSKVEIELEKQLIKNF